MPWRKSPALALEPPGGVYKVLARWLKTTARLATGRRFTKCGSYLAIHWKKSRPVARQRWSYGAPPRQWYPGTMPLAVVWAIHMVASKGAFAVCRHNGAEFA